MAKVSRFSPYAGPAVAKTFGKPQEGDRKFDDFLPVEIDITSCPSAAAPMPLVSNEEEGSPANPLLPLSLIPTPAPQGGAISIASAHAGQQSPATISIPEVQSRGFDEALPSRPLPPAPVSIYGSDAIADDSPALPSAAVYPNEPLWERIYPEHLFVNGYLSEVELAARESAPYVGGPEVRVENKPTPQRNAGTDASSDTTPHASTRTFIGDGLSESGSSPLVDAVATAANSFIETASHSLGIVLATDRMWSDRLLRLSKNSEGLNTAWLRDYTLKDDDAIQMAIEIIRNHALANAIDLNRIMLNGNVIWQAAAADVISKGD